MASLQLPSLILGFTVMVLQTSTTHSLTCSSQKFTNNKLYQHCNDLPTLSAYLHWNYNSSNSSMSIAFVAAPAKSDGWISWAINPKDQGMVGAQALIGYKQSTGAMVVKTYDLVSYQLINQTKLSFDVWDTSAENSDGLMKIFASLAVPEKTTTLNQVWQVGGSVTKDVPVKHEFQQGNINAKGTLDLTKGQSNSNTGGDSRVKKRNVGFYLFLVLGSFIIF